MRSGTLRDNSEKPMSESVDQAGQWPSVARIWHQLGSPLRPVETDLDCCRAALADWLRDFDGRLPRALILGVTPELYHLPWPMGSLVMAVDRTHEMVRHVWPGDGSQVLLADWRQMEWPDASFDLVLCDGGLHLLDHPTGQRALADRLERIIAPGGRFVLRLFVPPAQPEAPQEVLKELLSGQIPNLNCLKLRLGMALQESPAEGVALQTVWRRLRETTGDWSELAATLGWPLEQLLAIDAYRDSPARYHFVSAAHAEDLMCNGDGSDDGGPFHLQRTSVPSYPMGAQCPTLVFHRTSNDPGNL
jgi:SAM-dependent methyltransferase